MVYQWKYNMPISAQVVGEHFEALENKHGCITPKIILDSARSEQSAIHKCFEWNDNVAAEKYRETQASFLIRNLTVRIVDMEEKKVEPTRAYVNVKQQNTSNFISMCRVLEDDKLTELMLEQAKSELLSFQKKYSTLQELSGIFSEIRKLNEGH